MSSARAFGLARVAAGVVCITVPDLLERLWFGAARGRPSTKTQMRAIGARDIAVGAGLALSPPTDDQARWLGAGIFCDSIDLLATALPPGRIPRRGVAFMAAAALPSITVQTLMLRQLAGKATSACTVYAGR